MSQPRARVRNRPLPAMPAQAELDFASGVETLAALILSESRRLAEAATERPMTLLESRVAWNLAGAAKALSTGTLWGARHIRAKLEKKGEGK